MTAAQIVIEELNIPAKYLKDTRSDHVDALVHYTWIRQVLNNGCLPEKFVLHDTLSSEEVNAWLKQGENFGSHWRRVIIKVLAKSNQTVIPLPRTKTGSKPDTILTYSQILHYVTQTNHKNLWKEAYKKYTHGLLIENRRRESSTVELTDATTVLREVIARAYSCPVIRLDDSCQSQQEVDANYETHPNLLPSSFVLETEKHFLLIHEGVLDYTLQDCVSFSPAVLSGSHSKPLFIIYQLLRVMRHLHDYGLALGDITLSDIQLTDDLWIQVLPHLEANIYKIPKCTDSNCSSKKSEVKHSVPNVTELTNLCAAWVQGAVSNFDYLTALNKLAGRRYGDPRSHHVFPWVTDFTSNIGTNWRDLTKSKFRLNKGDRQLDLTYELPPNCSSAQVPHHISEVLSEITYYVYLARITPKPILCKYVRPQWVPAEYPSSIQRLQQWTPDECIPEFFTDPSVFKSMHPDLPDLEVPVWASSPEELVTFHRNALESIFVSERLHHWIDLTFGYKLSGMAAVKSKNVCLQLVDGHTRLTDTGVVQLFKQPHPQRTGPSVYWSITPPRLHHTPHKEKRKVGSEDEDCHSSGEDEEVANTNGNTSRPSPLALSRFLSRSRTSLQPTVGAGSSSPSSEPASSTSEKPTAVPISALILPHDYNPTAALMALESLHSFVTKTCHTVGCGVNSVEYNEVMAFKQVVAARRLQEMQVLGCLIVEIFLASKLRVFGIGIEPVSFSKRLHICRTVLQSNGVNRDSIPRCVRGLVSLLLQIDITNDSDSACYESPVTSLGIPPPSAHQLLQANLTSTILPFPNNFPLVYSIVKTLHEYSSALQELQIISSTVQVSEGSNKLESLTAIIERVCEWKVKSIANDLERLVEDTSLNSSTVAWIDLILPHILSMLADSNTSILTAWHLFDPVARALGPARCTAVLLEPMVHLYDCNSERHSTLPETTHRLKKRIKIYHRSFLLCLIVRFRLRVFLDNFVPHLVEAVGGYQDMDQSSESADLNQLVDCEGEGAEWETGASGSVLSPLDEDSSADSERNQPVTQDCAAQETDAEVEPEVFVLDPEESCTDDDDSEQAKRNESKSVPSVLLDQLDIQADEADETTNEWSAGTVETDSDESSTNWKQRGSDDEKLKISPVEYSKVSEVSGDSVQWLSHRLGPVLTARYMSRNLLRMLSLCYAGHGCHIRNLHDFTKLVGDENASKVLECLASIAALYGEQFIVIQYFPHMSDLIALCKKKFTINLEGGVIACLALLKHIIAYMADSTIAQSLQELILKTIIHPAMRLLSSTRQIFPSGVPSRQAVAVKLVECLYVLALRVSTEQRIVLIHTLQRFFLAFSKARGHSTKPDNNPASNSCMPSNIGESSSSDVVAPRLCTAESTDSSLSPYSSPSPAYDASEMFRSKALEEMQKAMSAELAHWTYIPFAKFYGESFMEQSLKNYTLIKELCLEFQREQCLRSSVQGWDEATHFSDLEAAHVGGKLDSEECGVVVVGNRMDIQEPVVKTGSPNVSSGSGDDITNLSGKTVECNSRHLRGNWLAYWDHEVGRSGKDNHFNVKQIKLQSYGGHCNSIRALTVLDNENSFLSASRDKSVKVWSLRSQGDGNTVSGCQWTYSGHRKSVMALGFVERVRLAVSCDSTVHLWDPFVGRVVSQTDTTRAPPVNTLRPLHPPNAAILTANTDATLRTLDTRICSYVSELKVSTSGAGLIRCIAVSPAGQWVALGQASGFLTILDLRTGTVISAWKGHEGEVLQLVAVNEQTIVSSSLDQAVSVWNAADGKLRFNLKGPTEPVHCLDVYGTELISGTTANRIGVYTAVDVNSSFSSIRLRSDTFKGVLTALHVLPLNRLLLLGADTGAISLLC